ncbi:MAG: hypothetical protein JST28_21830 [Acidobacteria bacterium]|nr:hypothetical protein [Acidobacteriota bacterium]
MLSLRKVIAVSSSLILATSLSSPTFAQQDDSSRSSSSSQSQDNGTVEGTVVASSRTSFVVRTDDNQFHVFTFDRDTNKPGTLAVGSQVKVDSDQGDDTGARHATNVTVTQQAGTSSSGTATSPNRNAAPIPPQVRNVENDIKHEARRWRLGARAGIALDPELVMFGVHSQMGPVFSRNVYFRPNAEFAWGEITDMVALNLEAVYRFQHARRGSWSPYLGGGPALNFIHQSFKTQASEERDISFGNFDYETGFNILMGFENRKGTFFEVKTSLYSQPAPVLRLILGKNF